MLKLPPFNLLCYDSKKGSIEEYENRYADTNEISCLLSSIEKPSSTQGINEQQLLNNILNEGPMAKKIMGLIENVLSFKNIDTNVKNKDINLSYIVKVPKSTQEDLLEMLELDTNKM